MTPNDSVPHAQLAKVRAELDALRRQAAASARNTLIIGTLLLTALVAYFAIGFRQIAGATEPEGLVAAADGMIDDELPRLRQAAADEITRSAPQLAQATGTRIKDAIPDGRARLERYALDQVDETLKESQLVSEKEFTEFLRANRPLIEKSVADLAAGAKPSEKVMAELTAAVEARFGADFKQQANESLHAVAAMNEKLARLRADKGLTKDEQIERRILMAVRRLQTERVDPLLSTKAE